MSKGTPEGWTETPFDTLFAFALGGDWGKSITEAPADWSQVRVIRGTEYRDWQNAKGRTAALRSIKPSSLEKRRLREGDIIVEVSGGGPEQPVGRSVVIDAAALERSSFPLICSNFCRMVRLANGLLPTYVNLCLQWRYANREFDQFQNATVNIKNLEFPRFAAETPILLPPLVEQKRIVAKVETLLARVNVARRRLSKVPAILKRFRQSVLAAACAGRLTEDWRTRQGCLEPVAELLTRLSNGRKFSAPDGPELPDLPGSWAWATPEVMATAIVDCPHSTPRWADSGRICLRTTNFRPGVLDLSEVRYVSEATYQERIARLAPEAGDVVYSREGGILGIACMIPPGVTSCLGQRMMLFRVNCGCVPGYFMHVLNSPLTVKRVQDLIGGTASPHLNVGDIKRFPVPLPPSVEQHEIVRRVEALFWLADAIEKRVAAATARADKLKQAILAKAFRGELVPTEAELARREGRSYEPASVLLDRIRAERAASPAPQKRPGRRRQT